MSTIRLPEKERVSEIPNQRKNTMPTLNCFSSRSTLSLDNHMLLMLGVGTLLIKLASLKTEQETMISEKTHMTTWVMILGWMMILLVIGFKRRDDLYKLKFGNQCTFNPFTFIAVSLCCLASFVMHRAVRDGKNLMHPSLFLRISILIAAVIIPLRKRVTEVREVDENGECFYRQWTDEDFVVSTNQNGTAMLLSQTPQNGYTGYTRPCLENETEAFKEAIVYDWTCLGWTLSGAAMLMFSVPSDLDKNPINVIRLFLIFFGCAALVIGASKSS